MLAIPLPPRHAHWVESDDPDEVTSWVRQRDGDHSRVTHGTGPYGFRLALLEGHRINLAWGRARLGQTLRARFPKPHLQVALEVPQHYSFGRNETTAAVGRLVYVGTGTEMSRRAAPGWVFALDCDDDALADEIHRRRPGFDLTAPSFPQPLEVTRAQEAEFGDALSGLVAGHQSGTPRAHAEHRAIAALAAMLVGRSFRRGPVTRLSAQRIADLEAWIEEHLGESITIGRLCSVAGVGERSLQLAFNARRGMSPMRFVTERRLAAAHQRLTTCEPDVDVTSVALDLGFLHLGRFSMAYREAFGELPSRTRLRVRGRDRRPAQTG